MRRPAFIILASWLAFSVNALAAEPDATRGQYIYTAAGCASCHAPPASDNCDDRASGDALKPIGGRCLKSTFGRFYVPNITPDPKSGLGNWSERDFIRAMTKGKGPGGTNLYPAFPYASYQHMTREDIRDLWAYLKTLSPVERSVPAHELSFPYNVRAGLRLWRMLYLDGKVFKADPAKSDKVNRGAYLVEGPGHCGECHTPRGRLGGRIAAKNLSGAPDPEGKGFVPNITPDKTGIGSWSEKDIVYALETGFKPDGDAMGGTMAAVQKNMAKLSPQDREAIAAYLKSVPAIANERPKRK